MLLLPLFFYCLGPHRPFTHLPICWGFSCRALGAAEGVIFAVAAFVAVAAAECFLLTVAARGGGCCFFAVAAGEGVLCSC